MKMKERRIYTGIKLYDEIIDEILLELKDENNKNQPK